MTILDGPLGTELAARGVSISGPAWSARALEEAPDIVSAIHSEYAAAGATVHTACTFRTRPESVGEKWRALAGLAVRLARDAVPGGHQVAGSVAPLADCYRPDLAPEPDVAREGHARLCAVLVEEGVDLLLCETFSNLREGLIAVECAVRTGVETWAAFTPGPEGKLATASDIGRAAAEAARLGARAVLVNCVAAAKALPYVEAVRGAVEARVGVYANAGAVSDGIGWGANQEGAKAYADYAKQWTRAGATIIGGCCGTGPAHIAALSRALR